MVLIIRMLRSVSVLPHSLGHAPVGGFQEDLITGLTLSPTLFLLFSGAWTFTKHAPLPSLGGMIIKESAASVENISRTDESSLTIKRGHESATERQKRITEHHTEYRCKASISIFMQLKE